MTPTEISDPPKFILDVHLGKLAKTLRILGFDTEYENDYTKDNLIEKARLEQRVLVSRNAGLVKFAEDFIQITSSISSEQLEQVLSAYHLINRIKPFTRCLVCNSLLEEISKQDIAGGVPPKAFLYYQEFFRCVGCKQIYWKGSHYDRMLKLVEDLQNK